MSDDPLIGWLVASLVTSFIRKVPTASGAAAVQIVHKQGRDVVGIEHIGSAHDDSQLAVLMEVARQRLLPGQDTFDLASSNAPASSGAGAGARVAGMSSRLLWDVLAGAHERLGFDAVGDETFKRLVLARIIEPTSKADTIRVLDEIGVSAPGLRTIFRSLDRCVDRDYRDQISKACVARCAAGGPVVMVMYDVTTLHFEAEKEDQLRRVGMSKEHRVDRQVQVGLLVDPAGFPLEIHMFEGNKAETKTLGGEVLAELPDRGGGSGCGHRVQAQGQDAVARVDEPSRVRCRSHTGCGSGWRAVVAA